LVEGDGIVIKGKGKERRDPPSPNSRRRHNKREKKKLKNPIFVSSLKSAKDAWEKAAIYLGVITISKYGSHFEHRWWLRLSGRGLCHGNWCV
jgi:hypothetical protein